MDFIPRMMGDEGLEQKRNVVISVMFQSGDQGVSWVEVAGRRPGDREGLAQSGGCGDSIQMLDP